VHFDEAAVQFSNHLCREHRGDAFRAVAATTLAIPAAVRDKPEEATRLCKARVGMINFNSACAGEVIAITGTLHPGRSPGRPIPRTWQLVECHRRGPDDGNGVRRGVRLESAHRAERVSDARDDHVTRAGRHHICCDARWTTVRGSDGGDRAAVHLTRFQLLRTVRRIVGDIEIKSDAPRAAAEPTAMPLDHRRRQLPAHRIERARADAILKPRHRRLGRPGLPLHRIPIEQQSLDRSVGQAIGIVRVGIATGEAENASRREGRPMDA
jgi:hypothetical protein